MHMNFYQSPDNMYFYIYVLYASYQISSIYNKILFSVNCSTFAVHCFSHFTVNRLFGCGAITILTRHYAPFVYKSPLTICMNSYGGVFISNLRLPQPYMESLIRTEELCDSDEREDG